MREQEGRGTLLKRFFTGWRDHPGVGLAWYWLNILPGAFPLGIDRIGYLPVAITKLIGGTEKAYLKRADFIFQLFGAWKLKALKDHFLDFDFEKFREVNGYKRKRETTKSVLKTFQEPSNLALVKQRGQTLSIGSTEKDKSSISSSSLVPAHLGETSVERVRQEKALVQRSEAWKLVRRALLVLGERKKMGSEATRIAIIQVLGKTFSEFHFRRISPYVSLEELTLFFVDIKKSFHQERSSEVLEEYARLFGGGLFSLIEFLRKEKHDKVYQGGFDRKELSEVVLEMAWGLSSLAMRTGMPHFWKAACEEIDKDIERFRTMNVTRDVELASLVSGVLHIFSLREHFPSTSLEWLRKKFVGGFLAPLFEVGPWGSEEEVELRLRSDLHFLLDWETLRWFSLRCPFQKNVLVQEGSGRTWVIHVSEVREWVRANGSTAPWQLKSFYALRGSVSLDSSGEFLLGA